MGKTIHKEISNYLALWEMTIIWEWESETLLVNYRPYWQQLYNDYTIWQNLERAECTKHTLSVSDFCFRGGAHWPISLPTFSSCGHYHDWSHDALLWGSHVYGSPFSPSLNRYRICPHYRTPFSRSQGPRAPDFHQFSFIWLWVYHWSSLPSFLGAPWFWII